MVIAFASFVLGLALFHRGANSYDTVELLAGAAFLGLAVGIVHGRMVGFT